MTDHLVLVTVGPVQDFIAQARRTRDLWFGSHLLSEIARAAAQEMAQRGARLIFPAFERGHPELEACDDPVREDGRPPVSVANKVLAEVPAGVDPKAVAVAARKAAQDRWRWFADGVRTRCGGLLAPEIAGVWSEQVDTLLEVVAAWAPLEAGYTATRRELDEAIAGRKALREFAPWRAQRRHVPKSSLDGARETVLREPEARDASLVRRFRIARQEQLDAVGLVKRCGASPEQFVPVGNVAFAGWLNEANRRFPEDLQRLRRVCADTDVPRIDRRDLAWTHAFPFDAQVLLPERLAALWEERGLGDPDEARRWYADHVRPFVARMRPEPHPYVACLVADGDRMGQAIDALDTPDAHRRLSRALGEFAREATSVIAAHAGLPIYAGGDDVLALVGVDGALACARALRDAFLRHMERLPELDPRRRPTLSVGLGVGHMLDGMAHLLDLGRRAERRAKESTEPGGGDDRDGLAVLVDKRSGGEVTWRAQWSTDPVGRLERDVELLAGGRLPLGKVYEVRSILERLPDDAEVLAADVRRTLARARAGARDGDGKPLDPTELGLDLSVDSPQTLRRRVERWVSRMLVARELHRARAYQGANALQGVHA